MSSGHDQFEEADAKLERVNQAQEAFAQFTQKQVDHIFAHVANELNKQRVPLAKLAVEETRIGMMEDKVVKNAFAAEYVFKAYKDMKTVGLIRHDAIKGIDEIASPVGPIAAILPTTNPTSTVIAKSLMALKAGNSILHLPHPRAVRCSAAAAKMAHDAAVEAGAPEGIIDCIEQVSPDVSKHVLEHEKTKFILATGGGAMVKASYSAGKPALGVGSGNAPVLVDESADLLQAVASIVLSKTFDNGTICASEQSTVVLDAVYDEMKRLFTQRGVHFVEGADRDKLGAFILKNGVVNPDIVGQSAQKIAKMIGISVPANTVVLAAEASEIGVEEPFSHEKLSPVLAMYRAADFEDALDKCSRLVDYGGMGHTAVMHTNEKKHEARIRAFEEAMPANHLIVNMPSAVGAVGLGYNFNINPSMTIGVGSQAGSSTSDNVTPLHLVNIKKMSLMREHIEWFKIPVMYFNKNCTREALNDLGKVNPDGAVNRKVLLVTDPFMEQIGYVDRICSYLTELGMSISIFSDVPPDPSITVVMKGVEACKAAQPDIIVALGGGSPMDAAKMMRVLYEHPELKLKDLAARFLELRQRTAGFPEAGTKVKQLICIPTTSGTGSEVTPFSVITDTDGQKYPLVSYRMTPDVAIVDPQFTEVLPKQLIAFAGFDALVHAVESTVSVFSSDYTRPLSTHAAVMLMDHLENSWNGNQEAREKVHHAAAIAGMAFSNAFLGINHSMSHALGGEFHIPHGLANAVLFDVVIRYNAVKSPMRMAAFANYKYPQALEGYAALARSTGVPEANQATMVEGFIDRTTKLRKAIGIPLTIQEAKVPEADFLAKVDYLAAKAFDDQCTGTNPRYPLISELRELFMHAYYGTQPKLDA